MNLQAEQIQIERARAEKRLNAIEANFNKVQAEYDAAYESGDMDKIAAAADDLNKAREPRLKAYLRWIE